MASMVVDEKQSTALLEGPETAAPPQSPVIVQVARTHGVSPIRQMKESLALRFGAQKLRPKDYYSFGLYDPAIPMAQKREYIGVTGNNALNARLSPPDLIPTGAFVGNKVLYTALLTQMGLGTTTTQAIASASGQYGTMPMVRNAAELHAFLTGAAVFPLFGKPRHGSLSEGSVRIERMDGKDLVLGNGQSHDAAQFCAEVFTKYPGGFLLQTALTPHAELADISGSAMGCIRVVTVNENGTPRPLYGLWKIPAPTAMSDNFWQDGSMLAAIDLASGKISACRQGTGIDTVEITNHPVTGAAIVGTTLPHWDATKELAAQAHALFPEFGVCGFDVAICDDGPKIVECNDNPFHMLYQLAMRRGINNPDLTPVWHAVETRQKERLVRFKAAQKETTKSKA